MESSREAMEPVVRRMPAANTPDAREKQLVSLAYDLAEKQILEGTASAQVVAHFLKLGSSRERAEQARIDRDIKLADAKIENLASSARIEALYSEAMDAMRTYQGQESSGDVYDG